MVGGGPAGVGGGSTGANRGGAVEGGRDGDGRRRPHAVAATIPE